MCDSSLPFHSCNGRRSCVTAHSVNSISRCLRHGTGDVPGSALRAKPPENQLGLAKSALTKRARTRLRHVVPLHVLNAAAPVADKVVVTHAFRVESRGAALHSHFTHQTRLHQVAQIVISRGPRT